MADESKEKLKVAQIFENAFEVSKDPHQYRVMSMTNIIEWDIGEILTSTIIGEIIQKGVEVTVSGGGYFAERHGGIKQ